MPVRQRANAPARDNFAAEHSVLLGQFGRGNRGIDRQLYDREGLLILGLVRVRFEDDRSASRIPLDVLTPIT